MRLTFNGKDKTIYRTCKACDSTMEITLQDMFDVRYAHYDVPGLLNRSICWIYLPCMVCGEDVEIPHCSLTAMMLKVLKDRDNMVEHKSNRNIV